MAEACIASLEAIFGTSFEASFEASFEEQQRQA